MTSFLTLIKLQGSMLSTLRRTFGFLKSAIIAATFFIASCAMPNAPAGAGWMYTETKELTYFDPYPKPYQKIMLCSKNIMGLISKGDLSLDALRAQTSIRKISSIEKTYSSRFGVISESCLIVTGE